LTNIKVLDSITIDKIAAGEVVERPLSVVKELVENAIDAKANAITVELKDGGCSLIRVTDNGCGMDAESLRMSFYRHATSKISDAEDLKSISSLGFRGEALSSIASVSQFEAISKTADALTGTRLVMEGGTCTEEGEVGAPSGTTMIVRNLFYNTPARKKFLKSVTAEGAAVQALMEYLALSHADISFKLVMQGQLKFQTAGNNDIRDVIFRVFGMEIAKNLIPVEGEANGIRVCGYIGKPELVRASRNYEIYFINGRYIKSKTIALGVEEGTKSFLMQHKFPFCVLHISMDPSEVDVNVHPRKMDVRFGNDLLVMNTISALIQEAMKRREMIAQVSLAEPVKKVLEKSQPEKNKAPEPFETVRKELTNHATTQRIETEPKPIEKKPSIWDKFEKNKEYELAKKEEKLVIAAEKEIPYLESAKVFAKPVQIQPDEVPAEPDTKAVQLDLFEEKILTKDNRPNYQFIGQVFDTYWMIQFEDKLLLLDQHACHEKVKYERFMKAYRQKQILTQTLMPPVIISLSTEEEAVLEEYQDEFTHMGFSVESFGGKEYALREVPVDLYGFDEQSFFMEILEELAKKGTGKELDVITDKIATMACKAAVKGNNKLSEPEAKALIDEMLSLENPYNCPHGRPTIISFSKYELDCKFKRIVT